MSVGAFSFQTFKNPPENIDPPLAIRTTDGLYLFLKKGNYDGFYLTTDEVSYNNQFIANVSIISNIINGSIYTHNSDRNVSNNENLTEGFLSMKQFSLSASLFYYFPYNITLNSFYFVPVNILNGKYSLGTSQVINVINNADAPAYYLKYFDGSVDIDEITQLSGFFQKSLTRQNYLRYNSESSVNSIGIYTATSWPQRPIITTTTGQFNISGISSITDVRTVVPTNVSSRFYYVVYDNQTLAQNNSNYQNVTAPVTTGSVAYRYYDTSLRTIVFNQANPIQLPTTLYYIVYSLNLFPSSPNYNKYSVSGIHSTQSIPLSGEFVTYPLINNNYVLISNINQISTYTGQTTINIPVVSSFIGTSSSKIVSITNQTTLYAIPYNIKTYDGNDLVTFSNNYVTLTRDIKLVTGYSGTPSFTNIGYNRATLVLTNFDFRPDGVNSILSIGDVIHVYITDYENPVATYTLTEDGQQTINIQITGLTRLTSYNFKLIIKDNSTFVLKSLTLPNFTTLNWLTISSNALKLTFSSRGKMNVSLTRADIDFEGNVLDISKTLRLTIFGEQYNMIYSSLDNTYSVIINTRANTLYRTFLFDYNYNNTDYSNIVSISTSITSSVQTEDAIFGTVSVSFSKFTTYFTITGFDYLDITDLSLPSTYGGTLTVIDSSSNILATFTIYPNTYPANIVIAASGLLFDTTYTGAKVLYSRGSKTLNIPTFTVPKQFEITSQIYPIITKLKINIDSTSKAFGEAFEYPIRLILNDTYYTSEIPYSTSGPYTITLDVLPSTQYNIKIIYKYDGNAYTDPYSITTVTTLPYNFTFNNSVLISGSNATVTLSSITHGSLVTNGKLYRSDNQIFDLTSSSIVFPTFTNLNSGVYTYFIKYRPNISILADIEDFTAQAVFRFSIRTGFAFTIESLNVSGSIATLIIKNVTVDGVGVPDNTTLLIDGINLPGNQQDNVDIASASTSSQRATFQIPLRYAIDYIKPAFAVKRNVQITTYAQGQDPNLPTIYADVTARITTIRNINTNITTLQIRDLKVAGNTPIDETRVIVTYPNGSAVIVNNPPNDDPDNYVSNYNDNTQTYSLTNGSCDITTSLDVQNYGDYKLVVEFVRNSYTAFTYNGQDIPEPNNVTYSNTPFIKNPPTSLRVNSTDISCIKFIENPDIEFYLTQTNPSYTSALFDKTNSSSYLNITNRLSPITPYSTRKLLVSKNDNLFIVPVSENNTKAKFGSHSEVVYSELLLDSPGYLLSNIELPNTISYGELSYASNYLESGVNGRTIVSFVRNTRQSDQPEFIFQNVNVSVDLYTTIGDFLGFPIGNDSASFTAYSGLSYVHGDEVRVVANDNSFSFNAIVDSYYGGEIILYNVNSLIGNLDNNSLGTTATITKYGYTPPPPTPPTILNRITLNRISSSIIHAVTPITINLNSQGTDTDILHVYTTTVKEFPYRPVYDRTIKRRYIKGTGSISFVDPLFQSTYTKFYGFATLEDANTYANTLALNPVVSNAIVSNYSLSITGELPSTIYFVPYATDTYNGDTLVSYMASPIILLSTDNMVMITGISINGNSAIQTARIKSCNLYINYLQSDSVDVNGVTTTTTSTSTLYDIVDPLIKNCLIRVKNTVAAGKSRGVYSNNACRFKISDTSIISSGSSNSAGIQVNGIGGYVEVNNSEISGSTYDVIQPSGLTNPSLQLYSTVLKNGTSSNGFGSLYQNSYMSFVVTGDIQGGTRYLSLGTQPFSSLSSTSIKMPFLNRTIVISAFIQSSTALTGGRSATVNFYKNSELTPFNTLTISGTGPSSQSLKKQNMSTVFSAASDTLTVELVTSESPDTIGDNPLFISLETY